ncbi:hypothetical protein FISHEDRAFT_57057 [Fistulina hepatica ATCC 64428]|nr:hypothetical protein FISHEDRAFT_57057 [Fistulina hepatica ATCC 64428]
MPYQNRRLASVRLRSTRRAALELCTRGTPGAADLRASRQKAASCAITKCCMIQRRLNVLNGLIAHGIVIRISTYATIIGVNTDFPNRKGVGRIDEYGPVRNFNEHYSRGPQICSLKTSAKKKLKTFAKKVEVGETLQ